MRFGTAGNLHLVIWLETKPSADLFVATKERTLESEEMAKWCEITSSVVTKKQNPGKEKDCLFGCSLKIGFQPIWPCGLEAGRARESGRQIIWNSNPGLSTNFLCLCYPEEQNDTGMGERGGGRGRKGRVKRLLEWGIKERRKVKEHEGCVMEDKRGRKTGRDA